VINSLSISKNPTILKPVAINEKIFKLYGKTDCFNGVEQNKLKMPKRIFILEDNADLRELYGYILEAAHYEIFTFESIADFTHNAPGTADLYLLDIRLPDGDGIQICRQLSADETTKHVPIIMVSAHKDIADVTLACPGVEFIQKPFDIDRLSESVARKLA
jgi:DNA-binding response OmpR family regulator